MGYMDFTQKLIFMYGPDWVKSQFGKNDDSIPEVGGKYWMEDELSDLVAKTPFNDQEYLMWLDDLFSTMEEAS